MLNSRFCFHIVEVKIYFEMPDASITLPSPIRLPTASLQPASRREKVGEAAQKHYGDQPYRTAATVGGIIGLMAPSAISAIRHSDTFRERLPEIAGLSLLTGAGGMLGGVLTEGLSRTLARTVGPKFRPRYWQRDQDPHRWNPIVRLAPLALSSVLGRLLIHEVAKIHETPGTRKIASVTSPVTRHLPMMHDSGFIRRLENLPAVQRYDTSLREKEEQESARRSYWPLLLGAGLAGLGYGAYQFGRKALSPEDAMKLKQLDIFQSNVDPHHGIADEIKTIFGKGALGMAPHVAGSDYSFYDYIDRMSQAASIKPFGKPLVDWMMNMRKRMGGQYSLKDAPRWRKDLGNEHYEYFAKGPLAAMVHQIRKLYPFYEDMHQAQFIDGAINKRKELAAGIESQLDRMFKQDPAGMGKSIEAWNKSIENTSVADQFLPILPQGGQDNKWTSELLAATSLRHADTTTPKGPANTVLGLIEKWKPHMEKYLRDHSGGKYGWQTVGDMSAALNHGEEMKLVRDFSAYLHGRDPALGDQLDKFLVAQARNQLGVAPAYTMLAQVAAPLFSTIPKAVGAGAMGLGGIAAGTWALRRWLASRRTRRDEAKLQRQQAAASDAVRNYIKDQQRARSRR